MTTRVNKFSKSFFGFTQKFKMRFLAKLAISRTRDHRHWIRKPKVAFLENLGRASPPSRELAFGYKLVAEKQSVKWRHHATPNGNHYRNYWMTPMKKQDRNLEIRKFEKNDHIEWAIKHLGKIIEWSSKKIWAWPVSLIWNWRTMLFHLVAATYLRRTVPSLYCEI